MRLRSPITLVVLILCALAVKPAAQSGAPKNPSTVIVSSSANPSTAGGEVTFSVRLEPVGPPTTNVPSGTVEFYDGSTLLGTVALGVVEGKATASLATPALLEGPHPISARYSGDDGFVPGSSEPLIQIVTPQGE